MPWTLNLSFKNQGPIPEWSVRSTLNEECFRRRASVHVLWTLRSDMWSRVTNHRHSTNTWAKLDDLHEQPILCSATDCSSGSTQAQAHLPCNVCEAHPELDLFQKNNKEAPFIIIVCKYCCFFFFCTSINFIMIVYI